jgi:hypothetical protein
MPSTPPYPLEFRREAARLLRTSGRSVPQLAKELGCVDRAFLAAAPNRLWVADITYLRTWEGRLYLVAVQDVFSRRIVGWSMADHMRAELVTDALQMALAQRRPAPGLIWHSDQGSQFVSLAFGQQARAAGITQSMGSAATATTTPSPVSFFARSRRSSSTAAPGPRRPSCAPRSSSTSKPSSTAAAGTPHSAFSRPRRSRTSNR